MSDTIIMHRDEATVIARLGRCTTLDEVRAFLDSLDMSGPVTAEVAVSEVENWQTTGWSL